MRARDIVRWLFLFFLASQATSCYLFKKKKNGSSNPAAAAQETTDSADQPNEGQMPSAGNDGAEAYLPAIVPGSPEATPAAQIAPSHSQRLVWKRATVLEADIMRALELTAEEVCQELGTRSCIQDVYLYAFGGNDPIEAAQYEPADDPGALTGGALDRVMLSACIHRVNQDKELGARAKVFTGIDLRADHLEKSAVEHLAINLYRRFLARDPSAEERSAIATLADTPKTAEQTAQLACMIVGTLPEFLFL